MKHLQKKFNDECAGAFCTINLLTNIDVNCETFINIPTAEITWINKQIDLNKELFSTIWDEAIESYIRTILQPSFDNYSTINL